MILGIDEVGRGPWAGPLVVGAVVLPEDSGLEGLTDSKKLSAIKRTELDIIIRQKALGYGLGWVYPDELDEVGLSMALKLATIRATEAVKTSYHEIIIDGTINFLKDTPKGPYVTTLAKADFLIPAVSAASIIAKVARDNYMATQDTIYPGYGFGSHVGYGTAKHRQALETLGATPIHRRSFAPIAKIVGEAHELKSNKNIPKITSKSIGDDAEKIVASFLEKNGHVLIDRNWKTKYCEIDIVTEKENVRYFTEVKYRSSNNHGGGVGAITIKKLEQMKFAAKIYNNNLTTTKTSMLAVAEVSADKSVTLLEVN